MEGEGGARRGSARVALAGFCVPSEQRPERRLALAARAADRADEAVSHRTSASPPPSRGRLRGGRGRRVCGGA
eukprot:scaffold111155_cov30-Phaeocystis_antarctica.AAC.1